MSFSFGFSFDGAEAKGEDAAPPTPAPPPPTAPPQDLSSLFPGTHKAYGASADGDDDDAKKRRTTTPSEEYEELPPEDKWERALDGIPAGPAEDRMVQFLWHFDMINDRPRNAAYRLAIAEAVTAAPARRRTSTATLGKATPATPSTTAQNSGSAAPSATDAAASSRGDVAATLPPTSPSPSSRVRVLDVGTGSGLLALLAAEAGATDVTAVEVEAAVASVAAANVVRSGKEGIVKVLQGHSTSPGIGVDSRPPFDVLVAELLDSGLLGENFIEVLRDAKARGWMSPSCQVIPSRARIYGQLVESQYLRRMGLLDPNTFGHALPPDMAADTGSASPFDVPLGRLFRSGQARALSQPFVAWETIDFHDLPPQEGRCRDFDVPLCAGGGGDGGGDGANEAKSGGGSEGGGVGGSSSGSGGGGAQIDAVVFWWDCTLDLEGKHVIDNIPNISPTASGPAIGSASGGAGESSGPPRESQPMATHQDHWLQAFTIIPPSSPHAHIDNVDDGRMVGLRTFQNDETIWFELRPPSSSAASSSSTSILSSAASSSASSSSAPSPQCPPLPAGNGSGLYEMFDSEWVERMNDTHRSDAIRSHLISLLHHSKKSSTVDVAGGAADGAVLTKAKARSPSTDTPPLVMPVAWVEKQCAVHIGDGPLLPLILAEMGFGRVVSMASSEDTAALSGRFFESNSDCKPNASTQVMASTMEPRWQLRPRSVHLVCGEPFFQEDRYSKTWGRSAMLRYWFTCEALRPFLAPHARLVPSRAVLRCALVECPELWAARQPVPEDGVVEGVNVGALNRLYSLDKTDSLQLWRHPHRFLSLPVDAVHMDLSASPASLPPAEMETSVQVQVSRAGTCHALAVWIEYDRERTTSDGGGDGGNGDSDSGSGNGGNGGAAAVGSGEEGGGGGNGKGDGSRWCFAGPDPSGQASPHLQGIRYCQTPSSLQENEWVEVRGSVNPLDGELTAAVAVFSTKGEM